MPERKTRECQHCENTFRVESGLNNEEVKYCPYCRAVILDKPDEDWMPAIYLNEIR